MGRFGKAEVIAFLEAQGVPYEAVEHEAVYTMEGMAALRLPFAHEVVKNLFLRDDKKRAYYLVVMPEDKPADLKALRRLLEARPLRFASEADLEGILGLKPGAVTPFGVLNDEGRRVLLVFDEELRGYRGIGVHPNDNTATLHVALEDVVRIAESHGNEVRFVALPWPEDRADRSGDLKQN